MRKFFGIGMAAAVVFSGGVVSAQDVVRQAEVGGETGTPGFPVRVIGTDGVAYDCRAGIEDRNGTPTRVCVTGDDDVGTILQFGSLNSGAVGAVVAGAVLLAVLEGDGSTGTTTTTTTSVGTDSDRRLKTDILQVGTTAHGLPLYQYRYVHGQITWEGVMAQDVAKVRPDAVILRDSGTLAVDYARLGIEMRRVD
ncbi:MAG: tail fiber domain-containing protein [Pseudomonadota bacterium]